MCLILFSDLSENNDKYFLPFVVELHTLVYLSKINLKTSMKIAGRILKSIFFKYWFYIMPSSNYHFYIVKV